MKKMKSMTGRSVGECLDRERTYAHTDTRTSRKHTALAAHTAGCAAEACIEYNGNAEIAGLDIDGRVRRGGHSRTGQWRTGH